MSSNRHNRDAANHTSQITPNLILTSKFSLHQTFHENIKRGGMGALSELLSMLEVIVVNDMAPTSPVREGVLFKVILERPANCQLLTTYCDIVTHGLKQFILSLSLVACLGPAWGLSSNWSQREAEAVLIWSFLWGGMSPGWQLMLTAESSARAASPLPPTPTYGLSTWLRGLLA